LDGSADDSAVWLPECPRADRWQTLAVPSLFERGGIDPTHPLVVCDGAVRRYGEARDRMRRLAHGLATLGVAPGERVALLAANRLDYLEVEAGIAAARGIMVALNWRLEPGELAAILRHSGAVAALVDAGRLATVAQLRVSGELPMLRHVLALDDGGPSSLAALLADAPDGPAPRTARFDDLHEIIFTSGTTGRPKGAVWTNGAVLFNSLQQIVDFRIGPDSSTYTVIDLYYLGGRHDLTWAVLHAGGTVHIKPSGNFDAEQVLRYVCEHRITHVLWVPTMIYDLLRVPCPERFDTRCLQFIMCGGQPLSAAMTRAVQQRFPHTRFVQVYGLTEGGGSVTFVPDRALLDKPGSAGRPSLHAAIRIVADDGQDCPVGADGEIWVRAPSMIAGYWDEPELTSEALADDWLRTGDVGHLDADGYLFVTGRKKDMIISGGMNIFPSEIEDVLRLHAAVADVAVIGVPHERWGEQVCAVVQLHEDQMLTGDQVVAYCAGQIASYKKPSVVRFVASMPRTATGKVQKYLLRDQVRAEGAA